MPPLNRPILNFAIKAYFGTADNTTPSTARVDTEKPKAQTDNYEMLLNLSGFIAIISKNETRRFVEAIIS